MVARGACCRAHSRYLRKWPADSSSSSKREREAVAREMEKQALEQSSGGGGWRNNTARSSARPPPVAATARRSSQRTHRRRHSRLASRAYNREVERSDHTKRKSTRQTAQRKQKNATLSTAVDSIESLWYCMKLQESQSAFNTQTDGGSRPTNAYRLRPHKLLLCVNCVRDDDLECRAVVAAGLASSASVRSWSAVCLAWHRSRPTRAIAST